MSSGISGGNLYRGGSNGLSGKIKTRGNTQDKAVRAGCTTRRAHEEGSARHGYRSESCFLAVQIFAGRTAGKKLQIGNFRFLPHTLSTWRIHLRAVATTSKVGAG